MPETCECGGRVGGASNCAVGMSGSEVLLTQSVCPWVWNSVATLMVREAACLECKHGYVCLGVCDGVHLQGASPSLGSLR